ncbi:protein kinase [Actinoplanes sp. TRM 88003]|uniref:non-specific serine/threonine protein kinase n=1 Tax=Paractinoplanes aksuensis TaxID=2939490 RepID=A0ABT1E5Y5_9ACTN|nr:protein kinase [Actinoplanes aksuensis]MCO8277671.1 protein kinase [Actinoplanes aksuensis]
MRILGERYRLERAVGCGGMAAVWQAQDLVLHRRVAVKVLAPGLTGDADLTRAVLEEARAAARLSHPRLAGVHDYGETTDGDRRQPFVVMEFIDGTTVADHLAAGGAMPWAEALAACAQVADALTAAHRAGLVHRDVKPGNVMLTPDGVKLVDFGLAVAVGQLPVDPSGRLWGTARYLPPEQLRRERAVPAGDVYALGLLLFECLAGNPAWPADGIDALLAQRRRTPEPILPAPDGLPAAVDDLYRWCLRADPADRPSAAEVARLLHAAAPAGASSPATTGSLRAEVPAVPPTRPRPPRRFSRRIVAMTVAPAAVLAGTLGANLVTSAGEEAAQAGATSDEQATLCTANYSSSRRADGSFTAQLQMANTGEAPLTGWSARFTVPDGHHVTRISGLEWKQRADRVTVSADDVLRPGTAATVTVMGTFDRAEDATPTGFSLNGSECARAVTQVRSSDDNTVAPVTAGRDRPRATEARSSRTRAAATSSPRTKAPATSSTVPVRPTSPSPLPTSPAPATSRPSGTAPPSAPTGEPPRETSGEPTPTPTPKHSEPTEQTPDPTQPTPEPTIDPSDADAEPTTTADPSDGSLDPPGEIV